MKKRLKVAIVGCGDIAGGYDERRSGNGIFSHAGAYASFNNIKIVTVFDTDLRKADHFCKYWNIGSRSRTLSELLSGTYDIVSVCTPDESHFTVMEKIARSRCTRYIWAEKPIAKTYRDAGHIIKLAKNAGMGLWLSNQRRWEPAHIRVKKMVGEKVIGDVLHVNGYYVKGITHIGCTMIDTLRFLCGEIDWVRAFPPFDTGSYGNDHSLRGVLGFEGGATAAITGCDGKRYVYSIFEIDIIGTKGRIRIDDNGDRVSLYRISKYGRYSGFGELSPAKALKTEMKWSMRRGLQLLLSKLSNNSISVDPAEEGLKDLEIVEALKLSAKRSGDEVDV